MGLISRVSSRTYRSYVIMDYDLKSIRENIQEILKLYPNQTFKVKKIRQLYQEKHNQSIKPPPGCKTLKPTEFFASLKIENVIVNCEGKTVVYKPDMEKKFSVQNLILACGEQIEEKYRNSLSEEKRQNMDKIDGLSKLFADGLSEILKTTDKNDLEWTRQEMSKALKEIEERFSLE